MPIPTPHISAEYGEIAKTVLMPGDPLRAKFIAENFLTDSKLVNNVRGVQGHTGKWKGVPVTVMASGMGIPSIGIYSWELYNFYGVENIIRIGSAGAISDKLKLMDIIAAIAASTDSNFAHQFGLNGTFAPAADFTLLTEAVAAAGERGVKSPWATSSPATTSIPTAPTARTNGRKWACWRWKWRRRACT